jgi:lipopolysaccharide transport system ATP-binding protein
MPDPIITVDNLSKKYLIGHNAGEDARYRYVALREVVGREVRNLARKTIEAVRGRQVVQGDEVEEFWALKDVSFEVERGEVLGIIGRNGAGKSTLLKILSRITEPTRGRVTLRGRVASLLEVGTGFHPELTGRENIYLNGAILGMTRTEIRSKFDEIVAFAEVERFLDTPVKRYSSGMYVRLAFAIAAHLDPEILIVDEVLAVGDTEFQKKCLGRMSEVANSGRTVLFVSHNMPAVETLCARSIRLADGSLVDDGDTVRVVAGYLRDRPGRTDEGFAISKKIEDGLVLESLDLSSSLVRSGDPVDIRINFRAHTPGRLKECALLLHSLHGQRIAIADLRDSGRIPLRYGVGSFSFVIKIAELPLVEGDFTIGLYLSGANYFIDLLELADLTVTPPPSKLGIPVYDAQARGIVELGAVTRFLGETAQVEEPAGG